MSEKIAGSVLFFDTPPGVFGVVCHDTAVTRVFMPNEVEEAARLFPPYERPVGLPLEASRQIIEYLEGKRKDFDVPIDPRGTEFFRQVWTTMRGIPYGHTATYGEMAAAVGRPKACRAVGLANNRNPIPIIIPCHRIIGANGNLTGFRGGLGMKKQLLELERANTLSL